MRNISLHLAYDGTEYEGWQRQTPRLKSHRKGKRTIQETIETALEKILGERTVLIGSGRTDSGVHAEAQVANFKTRSPLPAKTLLRALNALLPRDIAILEAKEAPLNFHARFDVKQKTYRYTILNSPIRSPLHLRFAHFEPRPLNVVAMRSETRKIKKEYKLTRLQIRREGRLIHIEASAAGFSYHLVRRIAGRLLEIGKNKLSTNLTAPACGLRLIRIRY